MRCFQIRVARADVHDEALLLFSFQAVESFDDAIHAPRIIRGKLWPCKRKFRLVSGVFLVVLRGGSKTLDRWVPLHYTVPVLRASLRPTLGPHPATAGRFCSWIAICFLCSVSHSARADAVDDLIAKRMREHHITGLSLAIIQDGKIIKAKGFGFADKSGQTPVTPGTLFQAGSISKAVAAVGALRLVQDGRLSLDRDVDEYLRAWKVPENEFMKEQKVTLRRILSHTAGLTVHGFLGYSTNESVPTLLQVLDGVEPANTQPIRVDTVPGRKWRYSGGGYTVMQQMIIDVTGEPFPKFMSETVLKPLVMTNSTYEQPLPPTMVASTASGYLANGKAVTGAWRVHPEMAAAGLWTTPSDLARFAMGIQHALAGDSNAVLSQATTRLMVTNEKDGDGLGVFVEGSERTLRFSHGGRNAGFDSFMVAYTGVGQGAVIMMNANDSGTSRAIVNAIANEYHWSAGIPLVPPAWQRDLFVAAHPKLIKSAALILFCGLAFVVFIAVIGWRRFFRRDFTKPASSLAGSETETPRA